MFFGRTQAGRWSVGLAIAAVAMAVVVSVGRGQTQHGAEARPLVLVAAIEGTIGPATAHHVEKLVKIAGERSAQALVLRLNTPGGLATSMRDVIAAIIASPVPVIGYVAPSGAHAASAGTYILYATHVAAMAPGTNLGAATPVQIGGLPGLPQPGENGRSGQEKPQNDGAEQSREKPLAGSDAMTAKATNDAVAFIRSLAELRGRNADWAEKAVREAASLSASQASQERVIDFVAADVESLLQMTSGRQISVAGRAVTLATAGATIEPIDADTITELLGIIANPNVAMVLMLIGIYGLIYEIIHPGAVAPGVVGAISLLLGLYALNQLPLNYAGLALLILGLGLMLTEALTPSFGILGFGGIVAFVTGSAMLIETENPAFRVSWWVIGSAAAMSAAFLILLLGYTLRAYRRARPADATGLYGADAEVLDWSGAAGHVLAAGERWNAAGMAGLKPGEPVRIRAVDGLTLRVERRGESRDGGERGNDKGSRRGAKSTRGE